MLKIYNTLSRKVEEFTPLNDSKVGMYTCGPTPYDFQHIGNFRTMIFSDLMLRTLQFDGYSVASVRNITDVDDKIIKKAKEKNQSIDDITTEYTKLFFEDLEKLNILPVDVSPKATEHITKMVKYIEELIKKGFAYIEEDGSVYFDISKYPDYGKLAGIEKRELKTGTRILSDEYSKDNIQDFALWKSVNSEEVGWDSPWGKGRPGWHIECSVMSQEYLGETFDLHLGGVDLTFPHHENEIAQSEGKTGKPFVNYFVHAGHLLVNNQKMSKSLGNFYTLRDLEEQGFDPLAFRYLVLSAHYRDSLNFSLESLTAAQNALRNLRETVQSWDEPSGVLEDFIEKFNLAINNDLNIPQALAIMWDLLKSNNPTAQKAATLLKMDEVLGLELNKFIHIIVAVPEEVMKLIEEREEARSKGDFLLSDQLRSKIHDLGFEVEDTPQGPRLKKDDNRR